MRFGRPFGRNENDEKLRHRLGVGCAETDRRARPREQGQRLLDSGDPPVRNGQAMADAGRTGLFTAVQSTEDRLRPIARAWREQLCSRLEQSDFAADVEVECDDLWTKPALHWIHR